jgi:hypothetical protein
MRGRGRIDFIQRSRAIVWLGEAFESDANTKKGRERDNKRGTPKATDRHVSARSSEAARSSHRVSSTIVTTEFAMTPFFSTRLPDG